MNKKILITQCDLRFGYNVAKSLVKAGYLVIAGGKRMPTMCKGMPKVISEFAYRDPYEDVEGFTEDINQAAKKFEADLVLPVHEDIFIFSQYRDKISAKMVCPAFESLMAVHDKFKLRTIAQENNIPYPKTLLLEEYIKDENLLSGFGWPLIIKPRMGEGTRGVKKVRDSSELKKAAKELASESTDYIIQGFAEGSGVCFGCLVNNGQIIAISGHLRLREFPVSGGTSTARLTFRHEQAEKYVIDLVKAVNFVGIIMVEFRYDPKTDKMFMLDINPRYWGGLSTAIESGVDFPKLHVENILNNHQNSVTAYPKRIVESRWLFGEIGVFFSYLFKFRFREIYRKWNQNVKASKVIYEDFSFKNMNIFYYQLRPYFYRMLSRFDKKNTKNHRNEFFKKRSKAN